MAWKQEKDGSIVISGFDEGIAPSPFDGIADLKGLNVTSVKHEASIAYNRVRLDQQPLAGASASGGGTHQWTIGSGTILTGTWINIDSTSGTTGLTVGHWYFVTTTIGNTVFELWSDFGSTQITGDSGNNSFTFHTLSMDVPIDFVTERLSGNWRYFVLDKSGVIWVAGTKADPTGSSFSGFTSSTIWSAITPHSTSTKVANFSDWTGCSITIMYGTTTGNAISDDYMIVFTPTTGTSAILQFKNSDQSGWPSNTGSFAGALTNGKLNFTGGHYSTYGPDTVLYFIDGPTIGIIQQNAGSTFNPSDTTTYTVSIGKYLVPYWDSLTTLSFMPLGAGIGVVAGGVLNFIYFFPDAAAATNANPSQILWMPEYNTQNLLQVNNYVLIFPGNKGNIYLTNGSSVVPLITVPDYIAGATNFTTSPPSGNFVQDPYFVWGGATYIRGRVYFSIKDQTATHTGNCGGVWSFVPSFSYFANQDVGSALRMENGSSLWGTFKYNGDATLIFPGQEVTAQEANGPQYIALWNQTIPVTFTAAPQSGATSATLTSVFTGITGNYIIEFSVNGNTTGTFTNNSATVTFSSLGSNESLTTFSVLSNSIDFSGTQPLTNGSSILETDAIPVGTFLTPRTFEQIELKFTSALASGESVVVNYRTDLEANWASAGTITSENQFTSNGSPLGQIILGLSFQNAQIVQLQCILTGTVSSPSWCRLKEIYLR